MPKFQYLHLKYLVLVSMAASALLNFCLTAIAHEIVRDQPSAEELAKVQPPMRGSVEFARQVVEHLRNQFITEEMQVLDALESRLRQMDHLQWDHGDGGSLKLAEYQRWQAEQELTKLLGMSKKAIELDFRKGRLTHDPDTPIHLDPQVNLLLVKVVTGDGPTSFVVKTWDLTAEQLNSPFTVPIASEGITYLLLKMEQLPAETTFSQIAFQEEGQSQPNHWHGFTFLTKPWGNLAVEVFDENGQPTPVLMRLQSKHGKQLWEPPGSVDLRPLLNDVVPHLSQLGRGYMFFLPGDNRGRYWIVPRKLETVLPAGDWEMRILHGIEYEPIQRDIQIESGKWSRHKFQLRRWTNMPDRGWYSGDDHVHSRLTSSEDAEKLLDYTRAVDIHVANILEMGDEKRTYYAQRGFGPEFRVHYKDHWLVPGQEDPRSVLGHVIGLNLKSRVRDLNQYLQNDWVANEIHSQGGLYGHTHMGANACFVNRQMALFTPLEIVDFNSIMQANLGTDLYYDMLNLGFRMTASAGADTPYGGTIGAVRVYAYTGTQDSFNPDNWFESLRAGKSFVTTGPMLDFRVNDALPGEEIDVGDSDAPLQVSVKADGLTGASAPARLRLVRFGETYQEVIADSSNQTELEINTMLEPGYGCWLAAHAVGRDGSEAHTTPIYVSRPGYRHWDPELAERLIAEQVASLDEIEQALSDSEAVMSNSPNPLDYWNALNARQAGPVRERIANARNYYARLSQTLSTERMKRNHADHHIQLDASEAIPSQVK